MHKIFKFASIGSKGKRCHFLRELNSTLLGRDGGGGEGDGYTVYMVLYGCAADFK